MAFESAPPLLLTGSHRSGSTWAGGILSTAVGVAPVREPFNPQYGLHRLFTRWFTYIHAGNAALYEPMLSDIVRWRGLRHWRQFYTIRRMLPYYRACLFPARRRLLFVDPIAAFSAEWLHRRFGFQVIVLWRHPAAFVASLKRLNWRFDFRNWLDQPVLMHDHLAALAPHLRPDLALIEEGAWLWRGLYQVLQTFTARNAGFIAVRHEDLAAAPFPAFADLFARVGLHPTRATKDLLRASTAAENPIDGPAQSYEHVQRHSAALVGKWRQALAPAEIARIREITGPVAATMYGPETWEAAA